MLSGVSADGNIFDVIDVSKIYNIVSMTRADVAISLTARGAGIVKR